MSFRCFLGAGLALAVIIASADAQEDPRLDQPSSRQPILRPGLQFGPSRGCAPMKIELLPFPRFPSALPKPDSKGSTNDCSSGPRWRLAPLKLSTPPKLM